MKKKGAEIIFIQKLLVNFTKNQQVTLNNVKLEKKNEILF